MTVLQAGAPGKRTSDPPLSAVAVRTSNSILSDASQEPDHFRDDSAFLPWWGGGVGGGQSGVRCDPGSSQSDGKKQTRAGK